MSGGVLRFLGGSFILAGCWMIASLISAGPEWLSAGWWREMFIVAFTLWYGIWIA